MTYNERKLETGIVETIIIFLFMNVEKFKSSSVVSFYTKLYTKKKFRVGKIEHFFKERLGNW